MREIYYNSDITPKAANEIKMLALYYDKIHIVNDAVYSPKFDKLNGKFEFAGTEALQFIPNSFTTDYKLLIDENLIAITKRDENQGDEYEMMFAEKISKLINSSHNLIFPKHPTEKDGKIITEEVYNIMKYMLDFEWGKPVEDNFIWWYYSFKLKWFLKLLIEGKTCISSSNNLNELFSTFIKETEISYSSKGKGHSNSLAFDAIKISLANPDMLSFEDILELKLKLGDELENFKETVNSIEDRNKGLFEPGMHKETYARVFYDEIKKPLTELNIKLKNLKSKTFREFITKLQNPLSYSPLLGTVVASMPIQITLLASMGLTSYTTFLQYKEEKKETINNGLYFLLKLR